MQVGQYDAAIEHLSAAAQEQPGNTTYQMALEDARAAAADQRVSTAQSMLDEGQPDAARGELETALRHMPGHPRAISMLAELDAQASALAMAEPTEVPAPVTPLFVESESAEPQSLGEAAMVADASPAVRVETARVERSEVPAAVSESRLPAAIVTTMPAASARPASMPAIPPRVVYRRVDPPPSPQRPVDPEESHAATGAGRAAVPASAPYSSREQAAAPPPLPSEPLLFEGVISRDDDRFPKELLAIDGIIVKLKDTSARPLSADVEVRVGKTKKRYRDLRKGARITGRGLSREVWRIAILGIDDHSETVHFIVEPAVPPRP